MTSSRGLAAVHRTDDAGLTGRRTRVWRAGPDDVAMANTAMANAVAGATPGCAVRVRGLRKQYRGVIAVAGIDLQIDRGEVFALLGPNGAGKTTTVEILEGHRKRDAGTVSVLGQDPGTAGRAWRARLGIVLQTATDAAALSVRETIQHFARYYPRPRQPEEVLELCGLKEKAGARVKGLSGGQRRRLDVALGIIGTPELLFLDEPTTGFDPEARRQFWSLIQRLA